MSKGFITKAIEEAIKESGLPADKVEEITAHMVRYINEGAKYGETPEGFLRWYTQDMGGDF